MKKQIPHKIAMIALLLVAFGVPFYFVHSQSSLLSYSDYILSAAAVQGSSVAPTQASPIVTKTDTTSTAWAQASGTSFIGSEVK